MRAVPMHACHGVGEIFAKGLAVGKSGESVVLLDIAELFLSLAALSFAHPGESTRHGNAGAQQKQRDAGEQAEISRQHGRLIALVEIDHKRATRLSIQRKRKADRGEVGWCRRIGATVKNHLGRSVGWAREQSGKLILEFQSGEATGEDQGAGLVIELVAQHAWAIARFLEHVAELRGLRWVREGVEQRIRLFQHLRLDAVCGQQRLTLELDLADLAGQDEGDGDDQRTQKCQYHQ